MDQHRRAGHRRRPIDGISPQWRSFGPETFLQSPGGSVILQVRLVCGWLRTHCVGTGGQGWSLFWGF